MNMRDFIHTVLIGHYSAYSADETISLAAEMNNGIAEAEALAKRNGREDIAEQMPQAMQAVYEIVPFSNVYGTIEDPYVHVDNVVKRAQELGLGKIV